MAKGVVAVEVFKERLRLRWGYAGQRFCIYIGLPDNKINRVSAEAKARQIELDMASGNFDLTLKKYKTDPQEKRQSVLVTELFKMFLSEKAKTLYKASLSRYQTTLRLLVLFFRDRSASAVNPILAEKFTEWLGSKVSPATVRERLILLNACWNWGVEYGLISLNPWTKVMASVKVPLKQIPKPFSKQEIELILRGFRENRYYKFYADFVEFLFGTGCRTGEAIGLRWGHVSDDCGAVWIGESVSRGVRKPTKTNRARTISLTAHLQEILLRRRPDNPDPEGLVFPAPKGDAIDDHNFRNRAWKGVLSGLGIEYRKPYNTRHTLISHALDMGMNPVMVAQLTGHDVKTLYENYAGSVNSRPRLPELLDRR